jgi:hypothetical protein
MDFFLSYAESASSVTRLRPQPVNRYLEFPIPGSLFQASIAVWTKMSQRVVN